MNNAHEPPLITSPEQDQALAQILRYPLTVLSAPDGYRKSSLLQQFAGEQDAVFLWVRLFWSQASGESFWQEVVSAVEKHAPAVARQLEKLGFPDSYTACASAVGLLEGLSLSRHLVLVLEDLDRVETQKIDKLLQLILQGASSQFHIVAVTHRPPLLYTGGYLLYPDCNFIGKEILQLEPEQTCRMAASLSRRYSDEECAWLTEYAGGWPHLIFYILSKSRGKTLNRYYISQLAAQMYRVAFSWELSPQMTDLLLVLCELEQFTLEIARAVLPQAGDDADTLRRWLDALAEETVFLNKQEDRYVLCPSAAEFLRQEAHGELSAPVTAGLRNVAAYQFSAGNSAAAVTLLSRRGDREGLLSLLDQHVVEEYSPDLVSALLQCGQELQMAQMAAHPVAVCQIAFLLLKSPLHTQVGVRLLENLREYVLSGGELAYDRDFILGQIELTLANRKNSQAYVSGLIRLTAASPREGGGCPTWISPSLLGGIHTSVGSMMDEVAAFQSLCATSQNVPEELSPAACSYITQAEYHLETGYPSKAIYYALKSLADREQNAPAPVNLYAYFIMGKASLLSGDAPKARELADRIGAIFADCPDPRLSSLSDICQGYLRTCLGQWDLVPAWICSESASRVSQHSSYAYLIAGRVLLHKRDCIGFEMLSQQWLGVLKDSSNLLAEIHYRVEKAISAYSLYGAAEGAAELNAALSLALPDEVCAPFAENGEALLPLLQYAAANRLIELPSAYSTRLNTLISSVIARPADITGGGAPLTRREKEILTLLCKGLNYQEIANTLVISQFTVRKHIQNIYAKLNVSDRVNALIRGRELLFRQEP